MTNYISSDIRYRMTTPQEHLEQITQMEENEKKVHPEFFNSPEAESPKKKKKWWLWLIIVLALLIIAVFSYLILIDSSLKKIIIGRRPNPLAEVEKILSPDLLKGELEGDVNVLFMGMRGEGEEFPYATNAVMLINYDVNQNAINTISFTRDLLVPVKGEARKIGTICELAGSNPLNCTELAEEVLENVTGIPVHYTVIADFTGFINMVDDVNRIEVNLKGKSAQYPFLKEKEFDTARDPNPEIFHLNGQQALTFVRWPKNAVPDFGRIERQQIFINAAEGQLMNPGLLLNPMKLKALLETGADHARTNFQIWEMVRFANYAGNAEINKYSLNTDPNAKGGILVPSGKGDNSLVPLDGANNFGSIHKFIDTIVKAN